MYNNVAKDFRLAEVFLHSIEKYKNEAYLYVPYASVISKLAVDQGFNIKNEVFADRNYNDDYSLVSRKLPNAVISSKEKVVAHVLKMVNENKIIVESGTELPVIAETLCLHGDNPNALEIIKYLNIELPKHNITIQK